MSSVCYKCEYKSQVRSDSTNAQFSRRTDGDVRKHFSEIDSLNYQYFR